MPHKDIEARRLYQKKYLEENKEILKEKRKIYKEKTKERTKEWNRTNKDRINEQQRIRNSKLTSDQKEDRLKKNKEWFENTSQEYKDNLKEKHKKYRSENKEKCNAATKKWATENVDKIRENRRLYENKRKKNDPMFRIKKNLRGRISEVLAGKSKSATTMELLGCSLEYFKQYMEDQFTSGMSWDNYGQFGWHCDHIMPCNFYDLSDPEQQKICFHYTNLQPLWWYDNIKKREFVQK